MAAGKNFGRAGSVVRRKVLASKSIKYRDYVRRVGRPKNEWASKVWEHARAVAAIAPLKMLEDLLQNKMEFER